MFKSLQNAQGIVDVFQERADKYMTSLTLAEQLLREPSHLSSAERELIATFTSNLNKCNYCADSHTAFAESLGVDSKEIQDVVSQNYEGHRLSYVFDYVKKLTLSPSSLTSEDFNLVISSGVTEEELKDAIAVCAAFNYFNRIVEGHFIETHPEGSTGFAEVAKMITKYGYDRRRNSKD
jgi:uncharacterized peroxidase-related enzyme